MSKWKQFQSPQLAHVILYLGHKNWETGNANWHHYSAKCSPPFDLLCISDVLFPKSFFFYSIQHFFLSKAANKGKREEWNPKSEALRLCTIIRGSNITFFDLEWFLGGGETLKWGHQGYRGWLVSKWLGYEWKHSLHRKYQTRLVTCLWIIQHKKKRKEKSGDDKMLLMSPSCIFGHQKDSTDLITAFLMHCVITIIGMKENKMYNVFFLVKEGRPVDSSCFWLYYANALGEFAVKLSRRAHFIKSFWATAYFVIIWGIILMFLSGDVTY